MSEECCIPNQIASSRFNAWAWAFGSACWATIAAMIEPAEVPLMISGRMRSRSYRYCSAPISKLALAPPPATTRAVRSADRRRAAAAGASGSIQSAMRRRHRYIADVVTAPRVRNVPPSQPWPNTRCAHQHGRRSKETPMTTPTHGADVNALRATAQAMCNTAEELIATDLRVTGALATLTWNGPDAMRARQAWDAEHGPALVSAGGELARAGDPLLVEADQQEQASAAGAGAGAGAGSRTLHASVGPAPVTGGPSIRATLAAELRMLRRFIGDITPSAETIGKVRSAIAGAGAALNLNTLLDAVPEPVKSLPVAGIVTQPVAALGAASDAASVAESWRDGDVDGAIRSGGSLLGAAVSRRAPVHGAAFSLVWEGTYQARDRWFTGDRKS